MFTEANVTVPISDMNRAIQFYTKTLGLKLKFQMGNDWAEVEAPGLTIGLHPMMEMHGPKTGKSEALSIGFTVQKLETAMDALKKKGVSFAPKLVEEGPVRLAFFTDPDGTPLYLCEVKE